VAVGAGITSLVLPVAQAAAVVVLLQALLDKAAPVLPFKVTPGAGEPIPGSGPVVAAVRVRLATLALEMLAEQVVVACRRLLLVRLPPELEAAELAGEPGAPAAAVLAETSLTVAPAQQTQAAAVAVLRVTQTV